MRGTMTVAATLAVAGLAAGTLFEGETSAAPKEAPKARAEAVIVGCVDASISGRARLVEELTEEGIKTVRLKMKVRGLPDGKHGVHIHETASCTPCGSAGGHFDPGPASVPSPDGNHPFHMGDLRNIEVKNGNGELDVLTTRVTLTPGPLSIFDGDGSAFIVHVNEDTFCPNGNEAGCAGGGRAACGIILPTN